MERWLFPLAEIHPPCPQRTQKTDFIFLFVSVGVLQPISSQFPSSISLVRIHKFLQPEDWHVTQKTLFDTKPSSVLQLGGCSVPPVGFAHGIENLACMHWDRDINKNKTTRRKSNAVPHPWGAGEEQHHWSCLILPPLHRTHYNFFILR